jgi:preprotein translocase subunit SecY
MAVTAACLAAWRVLNQIPVPGTTASFLAGHLQSFNGNSGWLNAIAGSIPVSSYSLGVMGIGPYIDALIILTLLWTCSRTIFNFTTSPEGRLRLGRWTRALAVGLALGQAYGYTTLMQYEQALPAGLDWFPRLVVVLELTGATMVVILLAEAIDEYGLGFGNGAILIYALGPFAFELHRIAAILAQVPYPEAAYLPLAIWTALSIAVIVAAVGMFGAVRHAWLKSDASGGQGHDVDVGLLLSGVVRPPIFAGAVIALPSVFSTYLARDHSQLAASITNTWVSMGPSAWISAVFVLVHAFLVFAFAYFAVATYYNRAGQDLARLVYRLTFAGATFLAIVVGVVPVLEESLSRGAGLYIPMDGAGLLVVAAVVTVTATKVERHEKDDVLEPPLVPQLL